MSKEAKETQTRLKDFRKAKVPVLCICLLFILFVAALLLWYFDSTYSICDSEIYTVSGEPNTVESVVNRLPPETVMEWHWIGGTGKKSILIQSQKLNFAQYLFEKHLHEEGLAYRRWEVAENVRWLMLLSACGAVICVCQMAGRFLRYKKIKIILQIVGMLSIPGMICGIIIVCQAHMPLYISDSFVYDFLRNMGKALWQITAWDFPILKWFRGMMLFIISLETVSVFVMSISGKEK